MNTTQPTEYEAGRQAHIAGAARIAPAARTDNMVGGSWAAEAKAWYKGWDAANLADRS